MTDTPANGADAAAADVDSAPFVVVDPQGKLPTGTMRRSNFADLLAMSHVNADWKETLTMIERCADQNALAILGALSTADAMVIYNQWQRHFGTSAGK